MLNTPEKSSLNSSVFSPVRCKLTHQVVSDKISHLKSLNIAVLDSPSAHAKSSRNDPIGIRDKIKAISKTIVENYRKWEAAHLRGLALCTQIERCKSRAIKNITNRDENGGETTLYPDEMKSPCDKLNIITTIFEDIRDSAVQSQREINSLINLGTENAFIESDLLLKSWNCKRMQNFMELLCNSYKNEYNAKRKIMENIAHSKSLNELVVHLCAWEFQMFVDANVDVLIRELIIEANVELETNK